MPITPDTTGFQPEGHTRWADPVTGDRMMVHFFDLVPDLPAGLGDLPRLRRALATQVGEVGGLIEAFVVTLDGQPALLQVAKIPLPDRRGQAYLGSITVPKATASAVVELAAVEGPVTGMRESMVLADVIGETGSPDAYFAPHPYAPESRPKLPWHRADDPRYDERLPDHPLSRVRRWLRHVLATARLDPAFAALPPFGTPVPVAIGLPIGPFLPLWTVNETVTFWRLSDPDAMRAQLGRGATELRTVAHDESREVAWLNPADGVLTLSPNLPPARVTPVSEETAHTSVTAADIGAAFGWIGELSVAAGERAEMLLVRTAAATDGADKFVAMYQQTNDGDPANPMVVVDTAPVPAGAEFWDTLTPLPGSDRVGFARARDADQALVDGRLTMWAVQTWDVHPYRLMLSYKPNPDLR